MPPGAPVGTNRPSGPSGPVSTQTRMDTLAIAARRARNPSAERSSLAGYLDSPCSGDRTPSRRPASMMLSSSSTYASQQSSKGRS